MPPKIITFIAPVYEYHPVIVSSLLAQDYDHWRLLLLHDGPCKTGIGKLISAIGDPRIKYIETHARQEQFGHPMRKWALEEIREGKLLPETTHIVVTNADNYHCPHFCSSLMPCFGPDTVAVYAPALLHNYIHWSVMKTEWECGSVDIACVIVRAKELCEIGWRNMEHSSDWTVMNELRVRHGADKIVRANLGLRGDSVLVVHN